MSELRASEQNDRNPYETYHPQAGVIEVICGPMFSGKTEELIRRIRRALIAKRKVLVFKPILDNRYSEEELVSHNGMSVQAIPINSAEEILKFDLTDVDIIAIDEVQFFDSTIVDIVSFLADMGKRVIVAGLDKDFRGEPFDNTAKLLAISDNVTKLTAICMVCGALATMSQRLINGEPAHYSSPTIMVGARELYEPRCRRHHVVPGKPDKFSGLVKRGINLAIPKGRY